MTSGNQLQASMKAAEARYTVASKSYAQARTEPEVKSAGAELQAAVANHKAVMAAYLHGAGKHEAEAEAG